VNKHVVDHMSPVAWILELHAIHCLF